MSLENGRLDINFRSQKPWLTTLMKHVEQSSPQATESRLEPDNFNEDNLQFPLNLNIVIQVVGSRGDVQPFVALGQELQKHGHRVRLATHLSFRQDVQNMGLEFFNIGGNPEELMAFMVQNPGLLPGIRTIRSGGIQKRRREMKAIFSGCWRSCYEAGDGQAMHHISEHADGGAVDHCARPFVADVIIANPPGFVHLSCAEKLGVPLNMMFTMPWSPTQAFPHPLANIRSQNTKPSVANFASYGVVEVMMWEGLGDLINHFRKKELGLDPLDAIRAPSMVHRLQIPYTYLWSPSLLPKPEDWPSHIDVCGFQFLSTESKYKPTKELDDFLKAGEPPIYIGFGSIVVDNPERLTKTLLDAVHQTGCRALISKGWSNLGRRADEIPDDVFFLDSCPHDWLFRHVSCVVHHGGAGTTAAGLLMGRPTVIVPFFGDQPFWGSIVARAGAGPLPIPFKELTAENLAAAIHEALGEQTRGSAGKIGEMMRAEQGVKKAVQSFHQHLDVEKLRCSICPDRPAVWWLRHSHIKLSAFAAYRVQEYDTNRNPRGPLSASAEVLYGLITDLVVGVARIPGQVVGLFPGSQSTTLQKDYRGREWAMAHFAECLSNQKQKAKPQHDESAVHPQTQGDLRGNAIDGLEAGQRIRDTAGIVPVEGDEVHSIGSTHGKGNLAMEEGQRITYNKGVGRAKHALSETRYHAIKSAKYALNFVLVLPTDLALSLSRGFHNAPRLYHDDTVHSIPKVIGIKSGFRAAGKEMYQGLYHGISGLMTQPSLGFQKGGGKGMLKGFGKGLGGVIFKPTAGKTMPP
ncbi:hypothetical protein FP744_10001944 [Trichoderma asperellum]